MRLLAPLALVCALCAGEPVVQPTTIPGKFTVTPQPFPALAAITAAPAPDRPVYGLYIWKNEYAALREEIRKVGWKQLRFGGPWDDSIMRLVVEDDVEVMKTLGGKRRHEFASDEEFLAAYLALTDAFLTRYGPGGTFFADNPTLPQRPITAVELWNEPNFHYMIPDRQQRAEVEREREALYAKLQLAAHAAIKAKWPGVRVVGFGAGGASAGDLRFIANVWKQDPERIPKSLDILATHPYVDPVPPETDALQSWGSFSITKSLDIIRATTKSPTMPIWYTEVGWAVSKADGGHFPTKPGAVMVSPLLQAAYVSRMYALALRLGVGRVHIMFATDTDTYNAGFFLRDKSWRPAAHAVQTMIRTMPFPKLAAVLNDGADGWYAWTFADASDPARPPVTMAFAVAGPREVTLAWDAPAAEVTDMLGAVTQLAAVGGKLTVAIGPCPVYLKPVR